MAVDDGGWVREGALGKGVARWGEWRRAILLYLQRSKYHYFYVTIFPVE